MDAAMDCIDTFVRAPIDVVVEFLMDLRNVREFAFGREVPVEVQYLSRRTMRVYNPLTKSVTLCENSLVRDCSVAVVEHTSRVEQTDVSWKVFLVAHDFGDRTHLLFGWYNTTEIKAYMSEMHGWAEFNATFVRDEVARKELDLIRQIIESRQGVARSVA